MKIMSFIQDHNKLNKQSGSKRHFGFGSTAFSFFYSIFNCNNKSASSDNLLYVKSPREKNHSQISSTESHQGKVPPCTSQNLCSVQILIAFLLWLLGSDTALTPLKTPGKKELTAQLQETSMQFWKFGIGKVKPLAFQNILLKHQFLFHEGS